MSENVKTWLLAMLSTEISIELSAIDNERTWADGVDDPDTREMHLANAAEHESYVEVLRGLHARVEAGTLP